MKTVQPIRSIEQIKQIEKILKSQSMRDYMLFRLGINSGLRISDILKLKVKDLRNQDYFILKEQKTGKTQR
ncbi:MAG: tyrosine-type recombinase/integrase, partial [Alphaproteobacteria bacterium]|nr:tyrosine-type recombinase/integrase [Alphaproteobacteria bacterium]